MTTLNTLYAAKCYWPGVTEPALEIAANRAMAQAGSDRFAGETRYLGSLLFQGDDLVLCLFEGSSRHAVRRASRQAGLPCDRVMDSRWLPREADQADASLPGSETS
jgi:hypothetical protein